MGPVNTEARRCCLVARGQFVVDVDDVVVVAVESPADEGGTQSACSRSAGQERRRKEGAEQSPAGYTEVRT